MSLLEAAGAGCCQGCLDLALLLWLPQSSKKRNRKHSGDDSFDEGSVSESESESESGQAEEEKEEAGRFSFLLLVLLLQGP